ncbi:MAG: dTMP kinase [Dehalococcoidales bacterium]|nr:dTMP kinase [Dehalococcoidales bacterium]
MSLFITFEGGEGSGKSVQSKLLYRRLSHLSIPAILTYEPGGTPLGKKLGRWLKWTDDENITPLVELLLFNAARAQSVTEIILPGLKKGKVVISDRYVDSTTVYQGYGRGIDITTVKATNNAATQGLQPELTILLDMPTELGLTRKKGSQRDRFEQEELAFHYRIREGYLKLAADEPERWLVVDATQSKEKVAGAIWRRVSQLLGRESD